MHQRGGAQLADLPTRSDDPAGRRRCLSGCGWYVLPKRPESSLHGPEQIRVVPHDGLGHPSSPTGVKEPQVGARPVDPGHRVERRRRLVAHRPVGHGVAADLDHHPQLRTPIADGRHPVDESVVEEEGLSVGVLQDVGQLVTGIPVVHVGRDPPHLERRILGLGIFVTVVEIQRNLGVQSQAVVGQRAGQATGSIVKLRPREPPSSRRHGRVVTHHVGYRLPCAGQVQAPIDPLHER